MRLTYSPSALKALRKGPAKEMAALRAKLQEVAADPLGPYPWAKRLTDQPGYRARQGDWRAVYRLDHTTDEMIVDIIAQRDEVYK
ncbi:type II toxin-antitoxin system RelE family toxin [Lichenibacterium ramalinae]|nr:hypothetical protein [Lichenibacterium ramalinae]